MQLHAATLTQAEQTGGSLPSIWDTSGSRWTPSGQNYLPGQDATQAGTGTFFPALPRNQRAGSGAGTDCSHHTFPYHWLGSSHLKMKVTPRFRCSSGLDSPNKSGLRSTFRPFFITLCILPPKSLPDWLRMCQLFRFTRAFGRRKKALFGVITSTNRLDPHLKLMLFWHEWFYYSFKCQANLIYS